MGIERGTLSVRDLDIDVVRKRIKYIHLSVYPPEGRVRVSVPLHVDDEAVRLAVIGRLAWIRKKQAAFQAQERQSRRELVSGESHYYLGRRYRLEVVELWAAQSVELRGNGMMRLSVRPGSTSGTRERVLQAWYRARLREALPALLETWIPVIGSSPSFWGIKRMKTRWGTCNPATKRIWLNLELAKKPPECLEYVLVHELTHLLESGHGERFKALMDGFLPNWRSVRTVLNAAPLAHESWGC